MTFGKWPHHAKLGLLHCRSDIIRCAHLSIILKQRGELCLLSVILTLCIIAGNIINTAEKKTFKSAGLFDEIAQKIRNLAQKFLPLEQRLCLYLLPLSIN